jgi:oxygen-independent coproporphyrinogen-3 oxidase
MYPFRRFEKRLTEVYVYPEICKYQDAVKNAREYMAFLDGEPPASPFMFYVHIPFCETLCYFCNYHKVVLRKDGYEDRKRLFNRYVSEIEAYARSRYFAGRPVRAVQFGGGTPSAVEPELIVQIMDAIRRNFVCQFEMVTMEGSVTSLSDKAKLRVLKDAGVQRFSFGVQTLNESIRKKLHITATVKDVYDTVEAINAVGFSDYSHDLMFNLPDQTLQDVEHDLRTVDRDIHPTYLDCYNLNVMPNTMFGDALKNEEYTKDAPTDDKEIRMLRRIVERTREMGYRQVMSNVFSKTRDRCVLTLAMELDGSESVGIGPSARGYVCGRGYRNLPEVNGYIDRVDRESFSVLAGNVATEEEQNERRLVMLGNFGYVDKSAVVHIEQWQRQIDFLIGEGYALDDGRYIRLTDEGLMWPGNVSELFFNPKQRTRRARAILNALKNKENPYNQDLIGVSAKLHRREWPNATPLTILPAQSA